MLNPSSVHIDFLREFTKEIILNIKKESEKGEKIKEGEEKARKAIQVYKLKQKIFEPEKLIEAKIPFQHFQYSLPKEKKRTSPEMIKEITSPFPKIKIPVIKKPLFFQKTPQTQMPQVQSVKFEVEESPKQMTTTTYSAPPGQEVLSLPTERLNQILKDKSITTIECSGPNKPLLVRRAGETKRTSITLTEEQILEIIKFFSENARIPIIGGLLRAAVGNLTISAITSEFIGGRFIINKSSPYNYLEG